ncbi:hypothetical protein RB596_009073 [Gaeumannomyces avenae]
MSDQDALTPRVFLIRHGATEWAKSGRYTGITDIDLAPEGIEQISSVASLLVGAGKLLDPSRLVRVFVSPRKRAKRTFELLGVKGTWKLTETEAIAEWNYGDYEGLKNEQIRSLRKERGLDSERKWDIWRDGCEGGESMDQITRRLDELILEIREIQGPCMNGEQPADVLIVAHGLILRCFVKRWIGLSVDNPNFPMMLNPGGVSILSYKGNNIKNPALHIGLALPRVVEPIME